MIFAKSQNSSVENNGYPYNYMTLLLSISDDGSIIDLTTVIDAISLREGKHARLEIILFVWKSDGQIIFTKLRSVLEKS